MVGLAVSVPSDTSSAPADVGAASASVSGLKSVLGVGVGRASASGAAAATLEEGGAGIAGAGGRTIALDSVAFHNLKALRASGLVRAGDTLVVTPNVQVELARHGVTAADLASAGVRAIPTSPIGAAVPATRLAQVLRGIPGGAAVRSAAADALNIAEAAGAGAEAFVTRDNHVLRAFAGRLLLPESGGTLIDIWRLP